MQSKQQGRDVSYWVLLPDTPERRNRWPSLLTYVMNPNCRSQRPRGLRRRSAAARLLRLWVRIPPGAWMFVCCECCVLSGRGLCDGLITRREESYQLWCVVVCDLEKPQEWGGYSPRFGLQAPWKKKRKNYWNWMNRNKKSSNKEKLTFYQCKILGGLSYKVIITS